MQGIRQAIIYGLIPHELGFCGPEVKATELFMEYLAGKIGEEKVRPVLEKFEGAYPYYELIAKSNGISDPLDDQVVEAYWIGNELLENVAVDSLKEMIRVKFSRRGLLKEEIAEEKAKAVPEGAVAHHSFHVLINGPVTGRVVLEGKLLDLCRVGWGKVREIKGERLKIKVVVEYRPLVEEKKLRLGESVEKEINWNPEIVPAAKIGSWVSFHWNQVCEVLNEEQIKNLEKYTERILAIM
jgi:hypothetical protein